MVHEVIAAPDKREQQSRSSVHARINAQCHPRPSVQRLPFDDTRFLTGLDSHFAGESSSILGLLSILNLGTKCLARSSN